MSSAVAAPERVFSPCLREHSFWRGEKSQLRCLSIGHGEAKRMAPRGVEKCPRQRPHMALAPRERFCSEILHGLPRLLR
jgi:hypothetical protein